MKEADRKRLGLVHERKIKKRYRAQSARDAPCATGAHEAWRNLLSKVARRARSPLLLSPPATFLGDPFRVWQSHHSLRDNYLC